MKTHLLLLVIVLVLGCAQAVALPQTSRERSQGMAAFAIGHWTAARALLAPHATPEDREAAWRMAMLYVNAHGGPRDDAQAMRLFRMAAQAGHARSYYDVGLMHERGEGVTADETLARNWYTQGVALGCAECARQLGLMTLDEITVLDPEAADHWFSLAARLGDPHGMTVLARLRMGQQGEAATDEAVQLLQEAADRGWTGARFRKALLLWSSHRRPEDARAGIAEFRALLRLERSVFPDFERTQVLTCLIRSAVLGWGMAQNWNVALDDAAELDRIVKFSDPGDDRLDPLREQRPVFELVRELRRVVAQAGHTGQSLDLDDLKLLYEARLRRLLPVAQIAPALAERWRQTRPDEELDPLSDEATHEVSVRLALRRINDVEAERMLPSPEVEGIGLWVPR